MPPPETVQYAALTDVGVKRSHNQDAYAAQPAPDGPSWRAHGHVFVVADGMGGHAVGEKASAKAVRDIPLTYMKHVAQEGAAAAIRRAFKEANAAIYQIGQNNPEFKGLGTTGTALFLRPEGAWVGHVGDSRTYRIRGSRVQQLTFDHSWVWEVAKRQGIDPDELGDFKKNVIIRSLGPDGDVDVDVEGPHPTEPGDTFLLCSDGLSNLVQPDELGAVVSTFPPEEAAKFLIELANVRGGPDNITCLIVRVPGDGDGPGGPLGRRAGVVRRAAAGWGKLVPWPITALGSGLLFAGLAIALKSAEIPGYVPALVLAAGLILAGLIGVGVYYRREARAAAGPADESSELNLHRDHPFEIAEPITTRFAELEASLKEVLTGRDVGVDWDAYNRQAKEADEFCRRGDWLAAFRARCLTMAVLALPFNKVRHKEEVFKPNWTKAAN